jgi:hypothetical protein
MAVPTLSTVSYELDLKSVDWVAECSGESTFGLRVEKD